MTALVLLCCIASQPAERVPIKIDPSRVLIREWQGFGCSLAWWAVFTQGWNDAQRREVCKRLFGRGHDCLALDVVRYNAGGTAPDAAPDQFRPGGKVQVVLDQDGSFHPERDRGQIACLRHARRFGARTFELFVNSPPHWMLRSGNTRGGDDGAENLRPECVGEYARWLVSTASRVEREAGVRFESIAPFNEPSAWWWRPDRGSQEGCRILPALQAQVIRALRRELDRAGRRTLVACSDENEPVTAIKTLEWLTDPQKGALRPADIGRVNVHAYSGWEEQERLRELVQRFGIRRLWMSEVSFREWEQAGYIPADMRCALPQTRAIVNDLKRLRPNAWVYWQAVEPLEYCLRYRFTYGLMQAAAERAVEWNGRTFEPGAVTVSKAFWAFMQFSRFIRPGYRIVETGDFWTVAALAPGGRRLVVVAHHDGNREKHIRLDLTAFRRVQTPARIWRTMDDVGGETWNCRAMPPRPLTERTLDDTLPPRSVTTYVFEVS